MPSEDLRERGARVSTVLMWVGSFDGSRWRASPITRPDRSRTPTRRGARARWKVINGSSTYKCALTEQNQPIGLASIAVRRLTIAPVLSPGHGRFRGPMAELRNRRIRKPEDGPISIASDFIGGGHHAQRFLQKAPQTRIRRRLSHGGPMNAGRAPPAPAPSDGVPPQTACGWITGFPMRTGFGAGVPIHDPWRFDAERLVASGETDCVLWISALGAAPPAWRSAVNFVALCERTAQFAEEPNVRIAVGRPGVDHDAVLHSSDTGTLVAATASARSSAPSVAEALKRIGARLGEAAISPC